MRAKLTISVVTCTLLMVPYVLAQAIPQDVEAGFWYLLVRRGERSYHELTRTARFMERPFVSLAEVFTIGLLGWFSRARARAANARQPTTLKDTVPQTVEVIPSKLKVRVFLHDVTYEGETIPCWSYVTCGLVSQHQKEIIFTLRREKSPKPEDYPRGFLELFAMIFHCAEKGQRKQPSASLEKAVSPVVSRP